MNGLQVDCVEFAISHWLSCSLVVPCDFIQADIDASDKCFQRVEHLISAWLFDVFFFQCESLRNAFFDVFDAVYFG